MTTRKKKQADDMIKKKDSDNELKGWRVKSLEDAFKPRQPRKYIVEGLFPESSLNVVFGSEGSMKSLMLMDMGICVNGGLQWLPYADGSGYKFDTNKCGVLYIDVDNGSLTDDERINAFALSHGLAPDNHSNFRYISMPEEFDISNTETRDRVWLLCQALGTKLLIMDNLGLINSKDENSHEMAEVMSKLRWLADRGLCVIVVHHQRKGNGNKDTRLGDNVRGHSSIAAALDISLFVSRPNINDETITIIPAKSRFAPIETFGASFKYTWVENTKELETAMFVSADINDEYGKAYGLVELLLQNDVELTKTELVSEIVKHKIPQKVARQAVDEAVKSKLVSVRKGAHNSMFLKLNSEVAKDQMIDKLNKFISAD